MGSLPVARRLCMSGFRYRPEVDGLRTFAILPVILFHLKENLAPGGYAGVDVFFVISGYLITSIILKEQAEGRFTFRAFWLRRVRRIVPALVAMLAGTALINQWLLIGVEQNDLGLHGLAALFSAANFSLWLSAGSYWGADAESQPLLHVWSLAVEEQFYLLYPVLLAIALARARSWVAWLMGGVVAASFALHLWELDVAPDRAFYLMPSRAWELGAGCLAAVWDREGRFTKLAQSTLGAVLSVVGLVAIVASCFVLDGDNGPAGQLLLPVSGAMAVILWCQREGTPAHRLLSWAPVVYCGKISYSLYLWHWPLQIAWHTAETRYAIQIPPAAYMVALVGASVGSYHLIETPARQHPKALRWILIAAAAMLVVTLWLWRANHDYDVSMFAPIRSKTRVYDATPDLPDWRFDARDHRIFVGAEMDTSLRPAPDAWRTGGLIRRHGGEVPTVVVLGDSHALMWASAIDAAAEATSQTVAFYTAAGVRPYVPLPLARETAGNPIMDADTALEWERTKLEHIARWRPAVVFISCRWSRSGSRDVLDRYVAELHRHARHVVLIEQPPELHFGQINTAQYLRFRGIDPPPPGGRFYLPPLGAIEAPEAERYTKGRERLRYIATTRRRVFVLATADLFANDRGEGWVLDGNRVLYLDDDHLADDGGMMLEPRVRAILKRLIVDQEAGPSARRASSTSGVDK